MKERRYVILTVTAIFVLIVITAIIVEILLHLTARAFPQVGAILFPFANIARVQAPQLPDFELIKKGNPQYPQHDANGFRNANIPNKVDIVTIGDSHTYGPSVDLKDAWPHVLERLTSCRVYNMSLGGYGPLQYATLAHQAMRFKPRLILVGIYFGNDLFDSWQMYLRHPERYPVPESLLQPALERERIAPLSRDVEEFFITPGRVEPRRSVDRDPDGVRPAAENANSAWSLRQFLSQNSSLWGFGRAIYRLFTTQKSVLSKDFQIAVAALTPRQLEYASIFEGAEWRTILTSRYREAVENDDDPRIRVGYWLTEWAAQHIDHLAKQNGIGSIFVLLPTKEIVFASKVRNTKEHKYFGKLITEENLHRQRLVQFMQQADISHVDMAPSLRSSAEQPYFENANGHPNVIGHEIIAAGLLEDTGVCE